MTGGTTADSWQLAAAAAWVTDVLSIQRESTFLVVIQSANGQDC